MFNDSIRDLRGREFSPGLAVVYPYRRGSRMTMRTGIIETIICGCGEAYYGRGYVMVHTSPETPTLVVRNPKGKLVRLTRLNNVVVVR